MINIHIFLVLGGRRAIKLSESAGGDKFISGKKLIDTGNSITEPNVFVCVCVFRIVQTLWTKTS